MFKLKKSFETLKIKVKVEKKSAKKIMLKKVRDEKKSWKKS